jgi:copper chaperone
MITFQVNDMTCGHCAGAITRAIGAVDPAAAVEVSVPDKLVRITSGTDESRLAAAIREAGYTPQPVEAAPPQPAKSRGGCCCGT